MLQLIHFHGKARDFNITAEIGKKYLLVGTVFLNDVNGSQISAIASQHEHNAESINYDILSRWLQGEGTTACTWRGLLDVLHVHCPALAREIEEVLEARESLTTYMDEASLMSPVKRMKSSSVDSQAVGQSLTSLCHNSSCDQCCVLVSLQYTPKHTHMHTQMHT